MISIDADVQQLDTLQRIIKTGIIKSPTAYYLEEEYKHYAVNKSCRPLNNQAGGLFCMENFQVYRDIQARTGGDISAFFCTDADGIQMRP